MNSAMASNEMIKSTSSPTVRGMLRDAVKLLCQNAINFEVQMTIQALIGITVDGSEVLLVDIREQIDKSTPEDCGNVANKDLFPTAAANRERKKPRYRSNMKQERISSVCDVSEDIVVLADCDNNNANDDLKLKHAFGNRTTRIDRFNGEGRREHEQIQTGFDSKSTEGTSDNPFFEIPRNVYASAEHGLEYRGDEYDQQSVNILIDGHCSKNKDTIGSRAKHYNSMTNNQSVGYGTNNIPWLGQMRRRRRRAPAAGMGVTLEASETKQKETNAGKMPRSHEKSSECGVVYKCVVCGRSIRHKRSFLRHQAQHAGLVYRCEICGKVLRRRDTFVMHLRMCESRVVAESLPHSLVNAGMKCDTGSEEQSSLHFVDFGNR